MKLGLQRGTLRGAIAQWILVRTFGYATTLLLKMEESIARPTHTELVRGVVICLYRQIQVFGYPTYTESPTGKRFNNQWP